MSPVRRGNLLPGVVTANRNALWESTNPKWNSRLVCIEYSLSQEIYYLTWRVKEGCPPEEKKIPIPQIARRFTVCPVPVPASDKDNAVYSKGSTGLKLSPNQREGRRSGTTKLVSVIAIRI